MESTRNEKSPLLRIQENADGTFTIGEPEYTIDDTGVLVINRWTCEQRDEIIIKVIRIMAQLAEDDYGLADDDFLSEPDLFL